ncbi:MAG: DoxX family protein [Lentimonas sp.]
MNHLLILFCSVSFLFYGLSCLFAKQMVLEFERYGLARFRALTGALQLLASTGLLIGLELPMLGGTAAAGLAAQMACGLAVRVKIGDPWWRCLPAAGYMLLCTYLAAELL